MSSDTWHQCHPSCPAPCLGGLTHQSPWHAHPTAAELGETLCWGNWNPHHILELPNMPAEEQRYRSCPKGPRAPKCRLSSGISTEHFPQSGRLQGACLHLCPAARGSGTQMPEAQQSWMTPEQPWAPPQLGCGHTQASLAHSGAGPVPGGTNKVTEEEIRVPQRGRDGGPQSPSPTPRAWLASPPGSWKETGWASVTLSPRVPNPIPSMPLIILKQRVVNQ